MRFSRSTTRKQAAAPTEFHDPEADLSVRRRRMLRVLVVSVVVTTAAVVAWISQVHGYAVVLGNEVALRARAPGQVLWLVADGTPVKRGDKVAELDTTVAGLRLKEAEADVAAVREQLKLERSQQARELNQLRARQQETRVGVAQATESVAVDETNLGYERYVDDMTGSLHGLALVSDRERRDVERTRATTQLGVDHGKEVLRSRQDQLKLVALAIQNHFELVAQNERLAEARIAALDARSQRYRQEVESATVRASVDGVIVRAYASLGSDVNPGDVLMTILDGNDLAVAIFVPEEELTNLSLAMHEHVRVRFNAYPLRAVEGNVVSEMAMLSTSIGSPPPGVDPYVAARDGLVLASHLRMPDQMPFQLRAGMTGTVLLDRRGLLWPLRAAARFALELFGV